jgi:hypothetical protein
MYRVRVDERSSRRVSVDFAEIAHQEGVGFADDLWPGLAGLIVLGLVVAVFALGYFVGSSISL